MLYLDSSNNLWFAFYNGTAWAFDAAKVVTGTTYPVTSATMACDGSGNFHIAFYQANAGSSGYSQLCYAKRGAGSAGTWGAIANPGATPVRAATGTIFVFIDGSGYPRILFANNNSGTASYDGVAYWNGSTWTVSTSTAITFPTAATADPTGNIYFRNSTTYIGKFSTANAWSQTWLSASNVSALCCDSSGNLYYQLGGTVGAVSPSAILIWNGTSTVNAKVVDGPGGTVADQWSWQKPLTHPLAVVSTPYDIGAIQLV
jgi:hypothetical protein